jgi:hypothetical protein
VEIGQVAEISLDALPGESFAGVVTRISPASDPSSSVVNYPVTIQLIDDNLAGVRAFRRPNGVQMATGFSSRVAIANINAWRCVVRA